VAEPSTCLASSFSLKPTPQLTRLLTQGYRKWPRWGAAIAGLLGLAAGLYLDWYFVHGAGSIAATWSLVGAAVGAISVADPINTEANHEAQNGHSPDDAESIAVMPNVAVDTERHLNRNDPRESLGRQLG
jgi:hypothetical protein